MVFAQIQSFNSYLCSTVHVAHAHKYRGARWVQDKAALAALTANVPNTMTECCRSIEEHYLTGPWVFGNEYTICDPYLFTIASWLESDGVDVEQFPKLKNHREKMRQRDAVSTALQQLEAQ
jgi:glutathione S-transferase